MGPVLAVVPPATVLGVVVEHAGVVVSLVPYVVGVASQFHVCDIPAVDCGDDDSMDNMENTKLPAAQCKQVRSSKHPLRLFPQLHILPEAKGLTDRLTNLVVSSC